MISKISVIALFFFSKVVTVRETDHGTRETVADLGMNGVEIEKEVFKMILVPMEDHEKDPENAVAGW